MKTRAKKAAVVPEKTPQERFVDEFLVDRDPYAAASRAGVARINIKAFVKKWMHDPTTVRAIQDRTDMSDLENMIKPQRIIAAWIEIANDRSQNASARNTALRNLAEIKKMYPDQTKGFKIGQTVMLVPAEAAMDDWDAAAQAAQEKLKDDVRK